MGKEEPQTATFMSISVLYHKGVFSFFLGPEFYEYRHPAHVMRMISTYFALKENVSNEGVSKWLK